MKPKTSFAIFGVAAVITAATFIIPQSLAPKIELDDSHLIEESDPKLIMRPQEDHPVTPEMQSAADSLKSEKAPDFALLDTKGQTHTLASLTNNKPLLLFFIEKECPCCLGAKHFVDRMADLYRGHLNAVGIINTDLPTANLWIKTTNAKFPVLLDPKQKTIRAFKAERGVYTTLVAPDGTIDHAYPGYSKEMLRDLSARIAKLANVPDQGFESAAAPDRLTSGCIFPEADQNENSK